MPKKGYEKPEQTVLLSPSPPKNLSGFVRKTVRWSPQVELQDAINTANVNLDRMPVQRTPVSKVIPQQDNHETQRNTSNPNIGSDGDTIPRSLYGSLLKKRLSLTPTVNIQHKDVVGDKVKSPLRVETRDLLDQTYEAD